MNYSLTPEHEALFRQEVADLVASSRFLASTKFIQHGATSVYAHSLAVAYVSCLIAERLRVRVKWRSLIRGALLHDYFLYDWHDGAKGRRIHGFTHPAAALRNALSEFDLPPEERNIILRHMFPLTPVPPMFREGWVVCLADKVCSLWETFHLVPGPIAVHMAYTG